jgi:hypothetical protein
MSAALVASEWRVTRLASVSLPTAAHVDAGDAEATEAPSINVLLFTICLRKRAFGMPAEITEQFLHGY